MASPPHEQRPRPRKSPKQARSHSTVEVIVEGAARILEARGHAGFSTNAVAETAGVSIGSLYQYFPDKDALVGALILRETTRLIADAEGSLAETSGRAALAALIHACVSHQMRRPALARLLDFEEARLPLDAAVQTAKEQFRVFVLDALARPDLPRQADVATAARDVIAIIKGMVDSAGEHGETDQPGLAMRVDQAVLGYLLAGRSFSAEHLPCGA